MVPRMASMMALLMENLRALHLLSKLVLPTATLLVLLTAVNLVERLV